MAILNWRHHALIQVLLTRGPLPAKEFFSIFKAVSGQDPGAQNEAFNKFLLKINKELSFLNFDLRACRDQNNGQVYYGLVNVVSDDQSKLGTKYSVPQLSFFKGIVEAIAQDGTAQGSISGIDALNIRLESQVGTGQLSGSQNSQQPLPAAFKSFTFSQKEKTLNELVQDKWLCFLEEGKIGVGVRSFLDLRSWFYNAEIPSCAVCNEAGLKAEVCPNEGCTVRIHHYCLKKKSAAKGGIVCPSCDTRWSFQVPVAEDIEEEEEHAQNMKSQAPPEQSSNQASLRLKRKREEEEEHAQNMKNHAPPEQSSNQASLRLNRRRPKLSQDHTATFGGPETKRITRSSSSRLS